MKKLWVYEEDEMVQIIQDMEQILQWNEHKEMLMVSEVKAFFNIFAQKLKKEDVDELD